MKAVGYQKPGPTTLAEHFGAITAANLQRAHALIESGKARGKVVLEGWD